MKKSPYEDTICVSVLADTLKQTLRSLEELRLAEVRFDKFDAREDQLARIFALPTKIIATARPGYLTERRRAEILTCSAQLRAYLVDIEMGADSALRRSVLEASARSGSRVIVSYHDFQKTPERAKLLEIVDRCFEEGGHVAKIACYAQNNQDAARLLGLLDDRRSVVVVGMGPLGRLTRIVGPLLGAELTFATRQDLEPTAPGQLTSAELIKIWEELAP